SATNGTAALGINDRGQIVGLYITGGGLSVHGFLLSGGTYTTVDDPLATISSQALGINNAGQIVGQYQNASGLHGFLLSGGIYTTLDDPLGTHGTTPASINNTRPTARPHL